MAQHFRSKNLTISIPEREAPAPAGTCGCATNIQFTLEMYLAPLHLCTPLSYTPHTTTFPPTPCAVCITSLAGCTLGTLTFTITRTEPQYGDELEISEMKDHESLIQLREQLKAALNEIETRQAALTNR